MSSFLGRLRNPTKRASPAGSPSSEQPQPSYNHPPRTASNSSANSFNAPSTAGQGAFPRPSDGPLPLYLSAPFVRSTIVTGNFKTLVTMPRYVDPNEWVALNIHDFYKNLNEFYAVVSEYDTPEACPTMSAGPGLDMIWQDANKKSMRLNAPSYIDFVFTWIESLLNDEGTFPSKAGHDYSPSFPTTAKHIFKQLLRVFAHIYHAHFPLILHLSLEAHWNALFAHFLAFGKEYDLLDLRDLKTPRGEPGVADLATKWRELKILDV